MDPELIQLLQKMTRVADESDHALKRINSDNRQMSLDIAAIREQRYRPYLASMGAILALFVSAVGYMYQAEKGMGRELIAVKSMIYENKTGTEINIDRLHTLENRLKDRTDNMAMRWNAHSANHEQIAMGNRLLADKVMSLSRSSTLRITDAPAGTEPDKKKER